MEQMIPSGMVPGLVTIKDKKGKTQNVWPIDAKELIASGDYDLVENGSVEAARMNANPLRSGRADPDPDLIVAEITGIEGRVVVGASEKETKKAIAAGDNADAVAPTQDTTKNVPDEGGEATTTTRAAAAEPTKIPSAADAKKA